MPDMMREKLGAYLDGELQGRKLFEMQAHLETCPACRAELAELQQVSHLLHASPLPEFTPATRFASQLVLQLPRRTRSPLPAKKISWTGLFVPTALLAVWIFIQVIGWLSGLLSWTGQSGWLVQATAWTHPAPLEISWISAAQSVLGNSLSLNAQANLGVIQEVGQFIQGLFGLFFWQAVVAGLYLAWLAIWWAGQGNLIGTDPIESLGSES